jgi:hypothetical protein
MKPEHVIDFAHSDWWNWHRFPPVKKKGNRPIMVHKSPAPNLKEQVFTIGGINVHDAGIAQAPDSAGAPKSVHDAPKSVFTILRNWCSRSSGIGVHDGPKFAGASVRRGPYADTHT